MAFQFGFENGEDDEDDGTVDDHREAVRPREAPTGNDRPTLEHNLNDMIRTLPERLSYSTTRIESPTGRTLNLPRRDLHDVRMQLLGEGYQNDEIVDQLDKSDIRSGIYEGGFKTWECSQDLASLLLDRGPRKDIDELVRCSQIVELGAGSALPTLVLFQHALINALPITFVLQDYNDFVLRLVTLPNILLTWALNTEDHETSTSDPTHPSQGDLEISESVLKSFIADIQSKNIELKFLSGPWSPSLAKLIPDSAPDLGLVVLAAETIYSPESTTDFVELLITLLRRVKMAKAMIGAKRVYFGVGGSVDGLKEACRDRGAVAYEIENHGVPGMGNGVGRALIEVQMY